MKAIKYWSLRNKQILATLGVVGSVPVILVGLALFTTPPMFSPGSILLNFLGAAILGTGVAVMNAFVGVADMLEGGSGKTIIDRAIEAIKE